MSAPIYDFLQDYKNKNMLRCHMPGHKGISPVSGLEEIYAPDLTEISGADSLFEADGIISQSENTMSSLYGTASTSYSAGGSTLCIQAMLYIMKTENRRIIAVRNVHRAFLNVCALLDLDVEWLLPEYSGGILSGKISPEAVENALKKNENPACLYVTSPDYTGRLADISALAEICHKYGARLIVDNAHGAHLHFFEKSLHPIALGADMCCDSAHKMLPALTGSAMLHTSLPEYKNIIKQAMSIFGSSSPSYLIMMSLDLCNDYIENHIRQDIAENVKYINEFKNDYSGRVAFADGEPFHITIMADRSGLDGNILADALRRNGAECEYSDRNTVILLMSPFCRKEHYIRLSGILNKSLSEIPHSAPFCDDFHMELPKRAMTIREAFFSQAEEIPVSLAEGRICASVKVPCPPAVPIAATGEIIDRNCINIFKRYGISSVLVVK